MNNLKLKAMKNIVLMILFFTGVLMVSCKKVPLSEVVVVRDCTGTYLRKDGKDYMVCNLEQVSQFEDGTKLRASFKRINQCKGSAADQIVCMMVHQNEGWIEVLKV